MQAERIEAVEAPRYRRAACGCLVGAGQAIVCAAYLSLVTQRARSRDAIEQITLTRFIAAHEVAAGV